MDKLMAGKYEWLEVEGQGGSGLVHKVYDHHLKSLMAVKEMEKDSLLSETEFRMLKQLRHPSLPAVTDYFVEDGKAYLVMAYIDGMTLEEYIVKNGKISQEKAAKWGIAIGEVLRFLHERKQPILYRDMKPANIMIDRDEKLWVIDFGTACCRYEEEKCSSFYAGTPGYAAPEQLKELELVDERSDIYGLGATLYHMLTGNSPAKPPFLMPPIREYDRALSPGLERCIAKATAQDREKRQKTVSQLMEELKVYRRADKRRRLLTGLLSFVYNGVLLLFGFLFYLCSNAALENGSPKDRESAMLLAFVILCLCGGKKMAALLYGAGRNMAGKRVGRIKNVFLSEKKGVGLLLVLLGVILSGLLFRPTLVIAEGKEESRYLDVVVRGDEGRKLLIRYDAVYLLESDFKLEVPLHNFEQQMEYVFTLRCAAKGEDTVKERTFYLKTGEP